MGGLTRKQAAIYQFLKECVVAGLPMPSHREIAERIGVSSTRTAADHLKALRKKGYIAWEEGKARSLRLCGQDVIAPHGSFQVPLFGTVPAGIPERRSGQTEAHLTLDRSILGYDPKPTTFALRVSGDSMVGRHILDGDVVILEKGVKPRSDDVVAALIDQESTLKTFIHRKGKCWLQAENPAYPDLIPAEHLEIQGVATLVLRRSV